MADKAERARLAPLKAQQRAQCRSCGTIACALFSGLLSELLGLTSRDIDLGDRVIRVRRQLSRQGTRIELKTPAARRDVVLMSQLGQQLLSLRNASVLGRP